MIESTIGVASLESVHKVTKKFRYYDCTKRQFTYIIKLLTASTVHIIVEATTKLI